MRTLLGLLAIALLVTPPVVSAGGLGAKALSCVAEICIGHTATRETVEKKMGTGSRLNGGAGETICYRIATDETFLHFKFRRGGGLDGFVISQAANCYQNDTPLMDLPSAEGVSRDLYSIQLGSSEVEVRARFGEPKMKERGTGLSVAGVAYEQALKNPLLGETVLVYRWTDGMPSIDVYVTKGRVTAVAVGSGV